MEQQLVVDKQDQVLTVTFNRPAQRNAMTWEMYEGLHAACEQVDEDGDLRVMVLRGAGGKAFIAGTDITQFDDFRTGADGIAYEARIGAVVSRLERVRVPTVAAVAGFCVGGGLAIAAVCDLRIATPESRFGVPIARTLGNCLSMNSYALLVAHLGQARTLDMILRARLLSAAEAHAGGFLAEVCEADDLDAVVQETVERLKGHAPLSMWATKEAVRRLRVANLPDGDDLVEAVFGSDDFQLGVKAFSAKQPAQWTGR